MINEGTSLTSGAILAESVAIFKRNWPLILLAGALEGLFELGQQLANRDSLGGIGGILLIALFVMASQIAIQGIAARAVFVREGIVDASVRPRFGMYMGVSALVLLGITFGSVLLIVPGIMLALRWALAANFTLTREMGVREALEASRDTTNGHRGEIFGTYVVFGLASFAPMLVLVPLVGGFSALNSVEPWSAIGVFRVTWSMLQLTAGLALGIGMFSAFVGRHGRLQEVFA